MITAEQGLAAVTLAACVVLGVRLCLPPSRRLRFDRALRHGVDALRHHLGQLWRWPAARRQARAEAEAVIQRARGGASPRPAADGAWSGNVYTPKSFRKPRRPDQLH